MALAGIQFRTAIDMRSRPDNADMFIHLSPGELIRRMGEGELWRILDVREAWEREIAAIAHSIDIPMAEVPHRLDELERDRPVAVLCHSGKRSARVAAYLAQQGFAEVANVSGGIDAWSSEVDDSIPRY